MNSTRRCFLLICAFALCPALSRAQVTPGMPPYGSFGGGPVDVVNLQNLNSHIDIPIFHKPGRGLDFSFAVSYDNSIYYPLTSGSTTTWQPVTNFGWRNPTVIQTGYISYFLYTYTLQCGYMGQTFGTLWQYINWSYVDPFGGPHSVGREIDSVTGGCPLPNGLQTSFNTAAYDASGFTVTASTVSGSVTATVYGADGKTINAPFFNSLGGTNSSVDANGNTISFSGTSFTDTLGMTALTVGGSGTAASPYQFTYTGPASTGAQTYTMHYSTFTVRTGFGCSNKNEYGPTPVALVDYIQLPNSGPKYLFQYEQTPDQVHYPGDVTGRLKSITLPTGGSITYTYTGANDGVNCADGSTINMTRAVSDGTTSNTWTYARTTTPNLTTAITAPQLSYDSAGNATVLTFDTSNHETNRKIYQGAVAPANLLRTVNTTWTATTTPATVITILEDGATQSETDTAYDGYGNLTSVTEYDWGTVGHMTALRTTSTTYLNDTNHPFIKDRVTSQTVKDGSGTIKSRVDMAYDATAQYTICRATPVPGHNDAAYPCTFYYRGNPTSTTTYTDPVTPSGATTRNTSYDQLGNVVAADLNCCQRKTWTYSTTTKYAYPDSITRGSSSPTLTTSATYDLNMGLVNTATDENLQVTTNTYDALGRLTDAQRPDTKHIVYAYDDTNHTVQITSPVQGTDVARQKTFADGLGRTIKQQILDVNNNSYSIVETQYDAVGRGCKTSNPHNSTAQYWTETRYDALGRITKTIQPDTAQVITLTYSLNAGTTSDPAGKQRKAQSDGLGRLTAVFEPDIANGNALTQQTSYAYNISDALTGITQGVQTRTYVYDAIGRLTDSTTPESGHFQFQYNSYNLMTQRTDARGVITTYGYDTLNRPTTATYNVGSTGVPATAGTTLTYGTNQSLFNNGRIITLADGVGSENYSYDNMGNTTQLQKVIGGTTYTTSYSYNLAAALTQITYPSNRIVQQWYDAIGRLCAVATSATTCSPSTNFASGFVYSPAQQVTGFNYGNGVAASFTYSSDMLQVQNLSYAKGATTLLALSYFYKQDSTNCPSAPTGNNGQIQCIKDTTGVQEAGRSVTYSYDPLSRLSTAVTAGSTSYAQWGLLWAYDKYGNRLNQTQTAGSPPTNSLTFAAPSGGALTNHPDGMCFDANGNLTAESGTCPPGSPTYSYDAENRLVTYMGTGGVYTYDGNSLRVKKVASSTTTVYIFSGTQVIAEYDNGALVGAPSREYIYTGAQRIATIQGSTITYLHPDHQSIRVSSDSNGVNVRSFGHYPYGETWYETGTASKLKFTTYERDSESTNDYSMAREYVNRFGRFLTTDPLSGDTSDPQSFNRYAYVTNDPTDLSDPSGECYNGSADWMNCSFDPSVGGNTSPYGLNPNFAAWYGQVSRTREEERCYAFQIVNGWNPCANPESSGRWQTFGLGEGVPPKDPCDDSDPTNKKVLDFIKSHWDAAKAIAAGLQTTPENILGLSGEESTWGQDPKIPKTNNFFNLHPVAPGQVGVYPPGTPPRKYNNALAVFPSAGGYEASAQAFASGKMGKGIKGITDSIAFADKLAALGYNGIPPQNPNFASLVRGAIDSILSRINCPQLSATVKKQK